MNALAPSAAGSAEIGAAIAPGGGRFAFFDVDETVVTFKSMFSYDAFWSRQSGPLGAIFGGLRHRRFMAAIQRHLELGRSREFINTLYYKRFSGRSVRRTRVAVDRWFAAVKAAPVTFYIPATLDIIRAHQRQGTRIVLVSGSFMELLAPIAAEIDADIVLATRLETKAGRYTGRILQPQMIGAGKALAVRALLEAQGADPSLSCAYGDHVSDVAMLEEVGQASIVSRDPAMVTLARQRGWAVIDPYHSPCQPETSSCVTS